MLAFAQEIDDWRQVDRNLRGIAQRRAALDADEARWLREAERLRIWRPLGMVSALDYMERVLGYAPHAAAERLRVARALESLPVLETALGAGALNFSAVRELTRVATPSTEAAWRDRALGKNVRQIEDLVAGHAPGDHPDDPANPDLRLHRVRFELRAEVYARLRQAQAALADEHGRRLDDNALVNAFCDAVLDHGAERTGRAKFQVMLTVCKQCDQGWQDGAGVRVAVDAAMVERARCDAQYIGSTNDPAPVRAEQDVPPSVVRFVWHRDGGRCQTPGCRSARGLEVHHVIRRVDGGSHDPSNLRIQCSACHMAIHRGTLDLVDGNARRPYAPASNDESHVGPASAPVADVPVLPIPPLAAETRTRRSASPSVAKDPMFDSARSRTQARDALVRLGWKPTIARAAVEEALSHVGHDVAIVDLIREALRRCPRPGWVGPIPPVRRPRR